MLSKNRSVNDNQLTYHDDVGARWSRSMEVTIRNAADMRLLAWTFCWKGLVLAVLENLAEPASGV